MGGNAGQVQEPRAVLEERQHIQALAQDGVEVEEGRGNDPLGLGSEERALAGAGAAWGRVEGRVVVDLATMVAW
ncbi:hypothetical protein GCM10010264_38080 [Streptomyces globisporus]|nr:hypothetical protein GCM10010264_38080 [Streptomyces globisporus]